MLALLIALFVVWSIYWRVAARDSKPAVWVEGSDRSLAHTVPVSLGIVCLLVSLCAPAATSLLSPIMVATGLGFASWARHHLGRNWAGGIDRKLDHEIVSSGPYRLVGHPIYLGMIAADIGVALYSCSWIGFVGVGLIVFGLSIKAARETRMILRRLPLRLCQAEGLAADLDLSLDHATSSGPRRRGITGFDGD